MTALDDKTITVDVPTEDLEAAYPQLVGNVDTINLTDATANGSTADLGAQADNTLSKVLAWRGRTTDAAGFQAALKASFTLSESQGHVVATYTPRALSIQAGLGALTGAQASLYARAVSTQSLVLPLLDGLDVLDPTANQEDVEASRTLVRESIGELVAEMGQVGGPRIPRVNTLFEVLTGTINEDGRSEPSAVRVGNQLGQLRERFGLVRKNVNDLDDEQILTSFYTVVDAIVSLQSSWVHQRQGFAYTANGSEFIGSLTTKLSWALAAAAQQLVKVRFLLGSVFLRDADLQNILVSGTGGHEYERMPLSDLLSWLDDFLSVRGPRFVSESGRDGVAAAFTPMAKALTEMVDGLEARPGALWPNAMRTSRVTNGIWGLAGYMHSIMDLVEFVTRDGATIRWAGGSRLTESVAAECSWLVTVDGVGVLPDDTVSLRRSNETREGLVLGMQTVTDEIVGSLSRYQMLVTAPEGIWNVILRDAAGKELDAEFELELSAPPGSGTGAASPHPGAGGVTPPSEDVADPEAPAEAAEDYEPPDDVSAKGTALGETTTQDEFNRPGREVRE